MSLDTYKREDITEPVKPRLALPPDLPKPIEILTTEKQDRENKTYYELNDGKTIMYDEVTDRWLLGTTDVTPTVRKFHKCGECNRIFAIEEDCKKHIQKTQCTVSGIKTPTERAKWIAENDGLLVKWW